MKDYYAVLNVSNTASADEIKRSFRRLALRYHPDKNPDPRAEVMFKEINEAYDVLGDGVKRQQYDSRRQNPFAEILEQAPEPPRHRDPAYRRPRGARPSAQKVPEHIQLMLKYIKPVRVLAWIGLVFSSLIFIDKFVPYSKVDEQIVEQTTVRDRRGGVAYFRLLSDSKRAIKIYPEQFIQLQKADKYTIASSKIFGSKMWIGNVGSDNQITLAYLYQGMIIFPLALLITAALALLFRDNLEFSFNSSIVSGVMTIVVWFLL